VSSVHRLEKARPPLRGRGGIGGNFPNDAGDQSVHFGGVVLFHLFRGQADDRLVIEAIAQGQQATAGHRLLADRGQLISIKK